MFSSRMLNNLFFNNADVTLEEMQQFMLTKNNCQTVLEKLIPIVESAIETNSINILNNIPIIKKPIPEKKEERRK